MIQLVCENCATPLPGGSKFCNECGTPVPGAGAGPRVAVGAPTDLRQALQMATAGEYEIHHELGRGGMGSVFLAREIGLDRLVAIKVLPPSLMLDEGLIVRFKREARMVAKLHHPNIIPVYRVHHSHNLAFYTMHFVSGRSLSEIMAAGQVLSLTDVEDIMLEAAAGLGYAHKRGVIHRDVKPANILLDAEGHVHLTDFGIAKALFGNTQLTETGAVIGTPQYMAPEQCEGRAVDGRADQYSLAVVGYQLLIGHPPFESDSMKELLYHHLFTPPKPLGDERADVPVPLRDAVHKALSKDPADRFDSMEDFRAAIEGKGPPVFVKWIDSPAGRQRTPARRKMFRRSTDLPTTKRLHEAPWAANGGRQTSGLPLSLYQRTLAGLAISVISIAAIVVLAVSRDAGLSGSLRGQGEPAETPEESASLSGPDLAAPAVPARENGAADDGSGSATAEAGGSGPPDAAPAGVVASAEMGRVLVKGELPPDAVMEIDGERIEGPLHDGAEIRLPLGHRRVVIKAAGFSPWSYDLVVGEEGETLLPVLLERQPPPQPAQPADLRSAVPPELLSELRRLIRQGSVLHEAGRYVEAAEAFDKVAGRASEALQQYRDEGDLESLIERAKRELEVTRLTCIKLNRPRCP
jgi:serine/threonine protein kinase